MDHNKEQDGALNYDYESDFEEDEEEYSSKSCIKGKKGGDSDETSVRKEFKLGEGVSSGRGCAKTENRGMSKLSSKKETKEEDEISSVCGRSNKNFDNSDKYSGGFRFSLEGETLRFDLGERINAIDFNKAAKGDCNDKSRGFGKGNGKPGNVSEKEI